MVQEKYTLRLYICGITPENQDSIIQFKKHLSKRCSEQFSLEVVDVLEDFESAEKEKIIATPTLLRTLPEPMQKIIMDFNDKEKILKGIDLILE